MTAPKYAAYKDSRVRWLGDIPAHWGVLQSRRMFAVRSEPALATDQMLTASQKYGVLFQKDFVEMEGRRVAEVIMGTESLKHVEPDDFIISMRSFQGGLEWSRLRGSTSFHYVMVKPVKGVHPPFFAHLFKSVQYIQALRSTTDLIRDGQELRYSNFVQVYLPLVPADEQEAIAVFLDREIVKIDALVEEQRRLIELLREKRQAVISQAVTKGLDPTVSNDDLSVMRFEAAPKHWHRLPLKRLLREPLKYGANEASDDDTAGNPRFVRITDIAADGMLRAETFRSLQPDVAEEYLLDEGDVLLARSGATVGKSFIYRRSWGVCCFAGYLIRARANRDLLNPEFLYWFCQSSLYWNYIESEQIQATIQNVSAERYAGLVLPLPPPAEQDVIVAFLEHETAKIDALTVEAQRGAELLNERRSALISAAVTGKIDVRGLVPQPEAIAA